MTQKKKLKKSYESRVFFGVCGGIGERFDIEPWIVRILFLLLPNFLLVYFILAICLD